MRDALRSAAIVEALPVAALRLQDGRVVEANAAAHALLDPGEDDPLDRFERHDRSALVAAAAELAGAPPGTSARRELRLGGRPPRRFVVADLGPHPAGGVLVVLHESTESRQVDAALAELATGVFTADAELRGRWIPRRVALALGLDPDGWDGTDVLDVVHPDDRPDTRALVGRAVATPGVKHAGALRIVHPVQPGVWWPVVAWVTWLPEDEAIGGLLVRFDAGLAADVHQPGAEALPGTVTLGDASPMGFLNLTLEGELVQRSTRVREILRPVGVRDDCRDWLARVHPAQRGQVLDHLDLARSGAQADALEVAFVGRGAHVWARLDVIPYRSDAGEVVGTFVNFLDVTAERQARDALAAAREELWQLANHDTLTGLFNRAPFTERLGRALASADGGGSDGGGSDGGDGGRSGGLVGLLVCDLDGFKEVNDEHGHKTGDDVLVAAARRLEGAVRVGDTACRFGGDEFLVLCEGLHDRRELAAVAERIVDAFARPVTVDGTALDVGVSVGGAVAVPGDREEPDRLLRRADRALYAAKDGGRGRAVLA